MTQNQATKTIENFVTYPLLIIIALYITASAVVPFINVNRQVFTIIFTLSGGIPALALFFNEKFGNR